MQAWGTMKKERIVKRYSNRKLYDTLDSKYVTLQGLARLIREGEDLKVVDNETNDDLTAITLAQIILEEERRKTHLISAPFLRSLIRASGATVQDLSDRATRGIEALGDLTGRASEKVRGIMEEGGRALEEGRTIIDDIVGTPQKQFEEFRRKIRDSVEHLRTSSLVQRELERVEKSLHALERAVGLVRGESAEDVEDKDESGDDPGRQSGTSSPPQSAGGPAPTGGPVSDTDSSTAAPKSPSGGYSEGAGEGEDGSLEPADDDGGQAGL